MPTICLNDLIGPTEPPVSFNDTAAKLGVSDDTLRRRAKELGLPPHYHRVSVPGKPWCLKRVRTLYPTEILLLRVTIKPEFATQVTVPDWLWGGRSQGEVVGAGGVQRACARGDHAPVYGEEGCPPGRQEGELLRV